MQRSSSFRFRILCLCFSMTIVMVCARSFANELDDMEAQHVRVSPEEVDLAKTWSMQDYARRYAVCFNPVRKWYVEEPALQNDRYEFLLTPEGAVIYRRNDLDWKYFPMEGVDVFQSRQGVPVTAGGVDMIAADGNRVMIKTADNRLFAADLSPEERHEADRNVYRQFVIRDPEWTNEDQFPPSKTEDEIIDALEKTHSFYGYSRILPGAWNVILENRTFQWISIRPLFDRFTREDTENETIVDIGVINLHKSMMSDNDKNGYIYDFGGEYHTRQPFFRDEVVNKDYGNFSDGITNFYLLTYDPTRQTDNLKVRHIDEQYIFSSDWYYYILHNTDAFQLTDYLLGIFKSPTLMDRMDDILATAGSSEMNPFAVLDEIKSRLLQSDALDSNCKYFLSDESDETIELLKARMDTIGGDSTDFTDLAIKITEAYRRMRDDLVRLQNLKNSVRLEQQRIAYLQAELSKIQWYEFWRVGDVIAWNIEIAGRQINIAGYNLNMIPIQIRLALEYCRITGENPAQMVWNYLTDARFRAESDKMSAVFEKLDKTLAHLAYARVTNEVIDTIIDVLDDEQVTGNPLGDRLADFLENCKLDHDVHNDEETFLRLDKVIAISADLLHRKKHGTFTSVAGINGVFLKYGVNIAEAIKGVDLASRPPVIDYSGRWREIRPEEYPPMFSADQNQLNGRKYSVDNLNDWTDPRLTLWWKPELTLDAGIGTQLSGGLNTVDSSVIQQLPTLDASVENVVVSTDNTVYSINWTFGSNDFSWRSRTRPQTAMDNTYVRLRRDMTLMVKGTQEGTTGYFYQKLYPFNDIIGAQTDDDFFEEYYGELNDSLNACFPEFMTDPADLVCEDTIDELSLLQARYPLHPIPNGGEITINSEWHFIAADAFEESDRLQAFPEDIPSMYLNDEDASADESTTENAEN